MYAKSPWRRSLANVEKEDAKKPLLFYQPELLIFNKIILSAQVSVGVKNETG